jgi:hypothetical protein
LDFSTFLDDSIAKPSAEVVSYCLIPSKNNVIWFLKQQDLGSRVLNLENFVSKRCTLQKYLVRSSHESNLRLVRSFDHKENSKSQKTLTTLSPLSEDFIALIHILLFLQGHILSFQGRNAVSFCGFLGRERGVHVLLGRKLCCCFF